MNAQDSIKAHDKYDYAMVTYKLNGKFVEVDINGSNYFRVEVKGPIQDNFCMASAGLKQIKKMNDEGWEVFEAATLVPTAGFPFFVFYLRKKNY